MNSYLRWSIVIGLFALLFVPLIVSSSLLFPFITGKGFFFRIVTEIIFALWLILAIRDPAYRPKRSLLLTAMGVLLLILSLATAWGANPYRSFWSNFERMEGLVTYLHLGAYFLILISILKTEKLWFWFSHSLLGVNAIIAVYSLLQLAGKLQINQGGVRVDATLGNATYLAVYEIFHIFLILFLLVRFWRSSWWQKGSYLFLGLIDLFILYKTATRGAILGLGLGLIISAILIIWLEDKEKSRNVRRIAWGTLGLAAVVIVGFFALRNSTLVTNSPTLSRFASISTTDTTTQSRFLIWNMSWQGFKERPLLGWGPENYILVFNKYYDPEMYRQEPWFDRSHNVVFDWLINAGVLGLLSYLALFVSAFYLLWWKKDLTLTAAERALFTGLLVAYFFHNLFVFDNLISYLLLFAVLGYIHFGATERNQNLFITSSRSFLPPIIIIILFIPILYLISLKPLFANQTLIKSLNLQNHPDKQPESFQKVFDYKTFASTEASEHLLNTTLGVVQTQTIPPETQKGFATLARDQILETIKREPENARYRFFAGSFFIRLGLFDEAEKQLTEARRLSPRKQTILFELGSFYINQKKNDEALALFREAYEEDPSYLEAKKIYALGAVYSNKLSLASELLLGGFKDDPSFLLDERLVSAYGAINNPNALGALWQSAIVANPEFEKPLLDFISDLKKRGLIS